MSQNILTVRMRSPLTESRDGSEDVVTAFDQDERLRISVEGCDVVVQHRLQRFWARELGRRASALLEDGESALEEIEPGRTRRCECRCTPGCLRSQRLIDSVLCVAELSRIRCRSSSVGVCVHGVEEVTELLAPLALVHHIDHRARLHFERGKEILVLWLT